MAKRTRRRASGGEAPRDLHATILDAAAAEAAEGGWRRLTLDAVAERAGLPAGEVYRRFGGKGDLLAAMIRDADLAVGSATAEDLAEASARDRLFDVLMRRLDALAPRKDAVRAILRDLPLEPIAMACAWPILVRAMARMLEAAGIPARGPLGVVRAKGLAVVYLATLRSWATDDSPDLARTMAALDRHLGRAEACLTAVCPRWRRPSVAPAEV